LASAWHTDADLGRPIEVVTDMSKSRKLGFLAYQATDERELLRSVRTAARGSHHSVIAAQVPSPATRASSSQVAPIGMNGTDLSRIISESERRKREAGTALILSFSPAYSQRCPQGRPVRAT
jgi:hypothetical protein